MSSLGAENGLTFEEGRVGVRPTALDASGEAPPSAPGGASAWRVGGAGSGVPQPPLRVRIPTHVSLVSPPSLPLEATDGLRRLLSPESISPLQEAGQPRRRRRTTWCRPPWEGLVSRAWIPGRRIQTTTAGQPRSDAVGAKGYWSINWKKGMMEKNIIRKNPESRENSNQMPL